ncbi:putative DNA replication licensing factor Mcm5 [Ascobolus immersus RN42]|uniref:DNA replication licensing factor MCM5 n=1 Tax=Ascobolus immersus RN42 TaxID=1160509 RepID=A0A3N4HWE1_ASCIM|nr:putative DNA replication licensing factor Mcm5 [Ascobolus immersus RN42]
MDRASVYSLPVLRPDESTSENSRLHFQALFKNFIEIFRLENAFIYRDQLRENVLVQNYYLDVDVAHLISYDESLAHRLVNEPAEYIPLFESAIRETARSFLLLSLPTPPTFQLQLHSTSNLLTLRDLDSSYISHLVRIPGIIISSSSLSSKATLLTLECRNCHSRKTLPVASGMGGVTLPRTCDRVAMPGEDLEKCPLDPYFVVHEKSEFVDSQKLKLQEAPDAVPVGDLPRHIELYADRYLCNRVVAGTRCTVMGIFSIFDGGKSARGKAADVAIRNPYIRLVGIQTDTEQSSKGNLVFTEQEEQEFLEMARNPNLYESFANSIAPSIYGSDNIKKAITCLLFGGSKKILPDGMKLRGDINVLLLGDPGTAKSQLLKFVEKVAPIAIYTSGKGSSAAGLTASVQRDAQTREFFLEGGAMVLADQGVVCIDEFDKMRDEDRVAIHEAMEQQTISIAKAGITTILNARTSVLAAANPVFGRYDDMKSPGDNIDFQTTILSRFDMIFIVKDVHDPTRDDTLARHVMATQMGRTPAVPQPEQGMGEWSLAKMRRYISYCRSRCAPRLAPDAAEMLSSQFVQIRKSILAAEKSAGERSSIPITVRQLEAIIRITESLAKMQLSPVATVEHVKEAMRLFLASTMDAVEQGAQATGELMAEVAKVEAELRRRLPIGWSTSRATLRREICGNRGFSEAALERALLVMQRRETVQMRNGGGSVFRSGV